MALLRKKNSEWKPSENKELQVGETIEINDYRTLVESGMAEYVDEAGNVLPLPGTIFVCGICYEQIGSHAEYVNHVMMKHTQDMKTTKPVEITEEASVPEEEFNVKKEFVKTAKKSDFGKKMAEARAKKRAEREAAKHAA